MFKFIEFIVKMVLLFASIVYSTHNIGHNPPFNSGLVEWGKCDDATCVGSTTDAVIALDDGLNDGCGSHWSSSDSPGCNAKRSMQYIAYPEYPRMWINLFKIYFCYGDYTPPAGSPVHDMMWIYMAYDAASTGSS